MLIKFSIRVVVSASSARCFVVQNTEVTIDGDKHLIEAMIDKIKEIPGVEIE